MKNNIRYKGNTNNTSVIIFFLIGGQLNKNSERWYFAWENLQGGFRCCCSFIFVLHFVVVLYSISRLLYHVTGTPPLASQAREDLHQALSSTPTTFDCLLLFHLPWALRFWVGIFFPTSVFYLTLFHRYFPAFNKASLGAGSSSLKFACRGSYWSSKYRPGPSVCLIHSNP